MVEPSDTLSAATQRVAWSNNNGVGHSLRVPVVYDFDSEDEDNVYAEETAEAVLPLSANFDSITREDANR